MKARFASALFLLLFVSSGIAAAPRDPKKALADVDRLVNEAIVFAKQPPAEMKERAFLERVVGTYEIGGIDRQITLREDGVLQYVVLGSTYELVPVRGRLFRLKGVSGASVEFLADASGAIDRIAIHGDGSVVGPRKR